jgi:hypothetical protein
METMDDTDKPICSMCGSEKVIIIRIVGRKKDEVK